MRMKANLLACGAILALALTCAGHSASSQHTIGLIPDKSSYESTPIIEPGTEPPGKWVALPNGRRDWDGIRNWRTRHGTAIVVWNPAGPLVGYNASFTDGSRGDFIRVSDNHFRHREPGSKRWIHGKIEITASDVKFLDDKPPIYTPLASTPPNLEADLANDAQFREALTDDRFALAALNLFRSKVFLRIDSGQSWAARSPRIPGAIISDLRGLGETFKDWLFTNTLPGIYPDDREGVESSIRYEISAAQTEIEKKTVTSEQQIKHRTDMFELLRKRRHEKPISEDEQKAEDLRMEELLNFVQGMRTRSLDRARASITENRKRLAKLDENADIYLALRNHLTRLGWRTETAEDRQLKRKKNPHP